MDFFACHGEKSLWGKGGQNVALGDNATARSAEPSGKSRKALVIRAAGS
jgi:hypothetical protein